MIACKVRCAYDFLVRNYVVIDNSGSSLWNLIWSLEDEYWFLQQWSHAQASLRLSSKVPSECSDLKWQRPLPGVLKCNVDAGVFQAMGKVGFGCVIMDSNGGFAVVRKNKVDNSSFDLVISDCISIVKKISNYAVFFVHRSTNQASDD
ncbi:hypothetical protein PTKIN_Ptkin10aG0101400 [Pterospermum kingtungense]